jgi:alanine dehydrogenase
MIIGVPKERRTFEYRVGLTPALSQILTQAGHTVFIEHDAGLGAGFTDQDFISSGAKIAYSPMEIFGRADLLLKVSRPLLEEIEWLRPGATIAGLLHMTSARQDKIQAMIQGKQTVIAYEQIQLNDGSLPVLKPMSQIGGRLAAQIGARLLQNNSGGKGILLGGIAGVPPAEVAVIGAGTVGTCAAIGFYRMGAHVTVLDTNLAALQRIYEKVNGLVTMISNQHNITRVCQYADVIVGAILVPGEKPPIVITREQVKMMKPRSVLMDISIDEGGCFETSRPTTHEHSYYVEEGIIHYCVPNIPSVVARTATYAFLNAAFPYILEIANLGVEEAIRKDSALERAVIIKDGKLIHPHRLPNP